MQFGSLSSPALHANVHYRYLITALPAPGETLDLIVLLHGSNATDEQWDDVGFDEALRASSQRGGLRPTMLLLPDGGSPPPSPGRAAPFSRFVVSELIPSMTVRFPITTERARRAIGGISLGGDWALRIAAGYPEEFGTVGGHSPVVPAASIASAEARTFAANRTRVWLDVADGDALRPQVEAFGKAMRAAMVRVMFQHHAGRHDRAYWRSQSTAYAAFYGQA